MSVNTAPFRPTRARRVALESTVYAQHLFDRPLRRAGAYCVSTAPFRPTQPRSTFRPTVLRRAGGVLCTHSTFSTDATGVALRGRVLCTRSTFSTDASPLRRARQRTVYPQHLFRSAAWPRSVTFQSA